MSSSPLAALILLASTGGALAQSHAAPAGASKASPVAQEAHAAKAPPSGDSPAAKAGTVAESPEVPATEKGKGTGKSAEAKPRPAQDGRTATRPTSFAELQSAVQRIQDRVDQERANAGKRETSAAARAPAAASAVATPAAHARPQQAGPVKLQWRLVVVWPADLVTPGADSIRIKLKWPEPSAIPQSTVTGPK